jgi:hypothetical protein
MTAKKKKGASAAGAKEKKKPGGVQKPNSASKPQARVRKASRKKELSGEEVDFLQGRQKLGYFSLLSRYLRFLERLNLSLGFPFHASNYLSEQF